MKSLPEQFSGDVAYHEMKVLRDDGLYRHLRFRRGDSYCMGFDIITWPGHLCYTGDMGTYVFARLEDMLKFFRGDRANYQYWAEKVLATDRCDGTMEFSVDLFKSRVREYITDEDSGCSELRRETIAAELDEFDGGEHEAYSQLNDWGVQDGWEWRLREYTLRFQWCCHALPWAIAKYDEAKAVPEEARS